MVGGKELDGARVIEAEKVKRLDVLGIDLSVLVCVCIRALNDQCNRRFRWRFCKRRSRRLRPFSINRFLADYEALISIEQPSASAGGGINNQQVDCILVSVRSR